MKALISTAFVIAGFSVAFNFCQPIEACPRICRTANPPVLIVAPVVQDKAPEDELTKKVLEAQKKGIEYLKSQQKDEGGRWTWENSLLSNLQPGGTSALAILALLESGVKANDAVIARSLNYLRSVEPKHTYVVSLVLCKVNQKADADLIERNVKWLEETAIWKDKQILGWTYSKGTGASTDNSNTRYAVSGLYTAHKAGFKVAKEAIWESIQDLYVRTQFPDGGWSYSSDANKSTHTMTAAAVLSLTLAKEVRGKAAKEADKAVDTGYAWLAKKFRLQNEPHTFYNFDVIAALGRASEKKDFGTKDKTIEWYRLGAEWLVKNQKSDGRWEIANALDQYPVISTAFALRFLASPPD
ncbi:MAG TPA: prenyltransferase/squalene oxidase repeat-containing protein [Gemmataceae bacterium]|jgi:hypothetical protein|nr:prenyltransferase/squalene oxidase repeat-containing protein [Gemmataceae bacterium]